MALCTAFRLLIVLRNLVKIGPRNSVVCCESGLGRSVYPDILLAGTWMGWSHHNGFLQSLQKQLLQVIMNASLCVCYSNRNSYQLDCMVFLPFKHTGDKKTKLTHEKGLLTVSQMLRL